MALDPAIISAAKDRAEALLSKGRLREALATYEKIESGGAKDPRIHLRMGDIARRLEAREATVSYYKKAAEGFMRLGFAAKAIAVCKMILSIDPSQREVEARLARLHARDEGAAAAKGVAIPRTPLFSDLAEGEFLEAVRKVRSRTLSTGEFLFRQGDPGDSIFMVAQGEVEIIGSRGAEPMTLARLPEGSVLGEFGFFSGATRGAAVRSVEASTVLELTKHDLKEIIERHPRVETVLFAFYKERVVDTLLASSELFRPLAAEDRKGLLSVASKASFRAGMDVVREGEAGDTMYLVKEGELKAWVGDGREVARLGPGDFFGEIALATAHPRVATVTAVTDAELVEFSRETVKAVIGRYPEIREALERVIRERLVDIMRLQGKSPLMI